MDDDRLSSITFSLSTQYKISCSYNILNLGFIPHTCDKTHFSFCSLIVSPNWQVGYFEIQKPEARRGVCNSVWKRTPSDRQPISTTQIYYKLHNITSTQVHSTLTQIIIVTWFWNLLLHLIIYLRLPWWLISEAINHLVTKEINLLNYLFTATKCKHL